MKSKVISILGLGYIGLPTAAMFASHKQNVCGVDVDKNIVDLVNSGKIHIVEPGLEALVKESVKGRYLLASLEVEPADVYIIAVPTPFLPLSSSGFTPEPDLSYVKAASHSISKVLKKGDLVILESTSPVGTTEKLASWLAEERSDLTFPLTHGENSDVRVAYCPERVLPGQIIRELIDNDRIIGGLTDSCSNLAAQLYKTFVKGECILTNARTAEMVKLTENASRDVSIAFANELSIICEKLDINVWKLIELANLHPRVNILQPGPGVGGHCIAVDPWFIVSRSREEAKLISAARVINDTKPEWVIKKVERAIEEVLRSDLKKKSSHLCIACYGLSFKPNIDDLRESPAMLIANKIIEMEIGKVLLVEPNIKQLPEGFDNRLLTDFEFAATTADIHILLVDHDEFKDSRPETGHILDTRGIWQ